jgi:hypothetical protein
MSERTTCWRNYNFLPRIVSRSWPASMNTVLLTPCPHSRYFQPVLEPSIPALLRERASLQPSETAYTFVDYEQDWAGVAESLMWSRLRPRVHNIERDLRLCA